MAIESPRTPVLGRPMVAEHRVHFLLGTKQDPLAALVFSCMGTHMGLSFCEGGFKGKPKGHHPVLGGSSLKRQTHIGPTPMHQAEPPTFTHRKTVKLYGDIAGTWLGILVGRPQKCQIA